MSILVWFKLVWLVAVFGKSDYEWLLIVLLAGFLTLHKHWQLELRYMLICGSIGIAIDSLHSNLGLFIFTPNPLLPIPLWHICIWFALVPVIRHALGFLLTKPILAGILAAVAGPIAYFSARYFDAVSFTQSDNITFTILALGWFIAVTTMVLVCKKLDKRYAQTEQQLSLS